VGAPAAQVLERSEWDVVIVGAGPAGLTTARVLADAGVSVIVLEEHEVVGDPVHCTGILGLEAFDELDLPRDTICTLVRTARFRGRDRRSVVVDLDAVIAAVVDRGRFDRALAARAASAGAVIACGVRVRDVAVSSDGVTARVETVDHPDGQVRGRVCVLACGAQYRFNRRLGLGIPRAYLHTAQIETAFCPVDAVEIDLHRSLAPGGFAWLVPLHREDACLARIGLMATDRPAERFRDYTAHLMERHGAAPPKAPPRLKMLPLAPVARTFSDRVVAVGDAAGLAKPTTGGGIYYSLLSGRIAGDVIADALRQNRTDAASLKRYETRWRSRLGPEVRTGLAFRTVAARFDDRAVDALLDLAAVDGIIPLLRRTANFNWHRAAALALLRDRGFRKIVLSSLWG
jgi:digeranylgeranylglycerophospholipid reductase